MKWGIIFSAIGALFGALSFAANIFLYWDRYKQRFLKIKSSLDQKADHIYFYMNMIISSVSLLFGAILLIDNLVFNVKIFSLPKISPLLIHSKQAYIGILFIFISGAFVIFVLNSKLVRNQPYYKTKKSIIISIFFLCVFSAFLVLYSFDFSFTEIFRIIGYTFQKHIN